MRYGVSIGFSGGSSAMAFPITQEVQESELKAMADLLRKAPQDRACCRVIARDRVTAQGVDDVPALIYDPRSVVYAQPIYVKDD